MKLSQGAIMRDLFAEACHLGADEHVAIKISEAAIERICGPYLQEVCLSTRRRLLDEVRRIAKERGPLHEAWAGGGEK